MLSISEFTGSLFIKSLCYHLEREYSAGGVDAKDLHAVFLDVQNEINNTGVYVGSNNQANRQVVEYSSSLRYSIRFRAS